MNTLKQEILIAVHIGEFTYSDEKPDVESLMQECQEPDGILLSCLPCYTNDLNAMHEAEKSLTIEECRIYDRVLTSIQWSAEIYKSAAYRWGATAAQKAEAFLKTIGKWE